MFLEVKGLNTFYGNLHALWDLDIQVEAGEIVALIGNNGAGKSTLMKSIIGLVASQDGSIRYDGEEIRGLPANKVVRKGITLSPEGRQVFPRMTVYENLRMGGFSCKPADVENSYERVFTLFPRLLERKNQVAGTLSGGEQQMLAIGRAIMSNPKMLLLDEPSLGLSPLLSEKIFELIKKIREQDVSILLVEQNAVGALEIADRGYIMENGHIGFHGTSREIRDNPVVHEMYLGRVYEE
jgi:branched-chain amino acid transport system ATP-binding protein